MKQSEYALSATQINSFGANFKNFYALCKPRVTALIVFTAMIGMFLATPHMVPLDILLAATIGIGMASGAAAAFNCLIEQTIDAKMARTSWRAMAKGEIGSGTALLFAATLAALGSVLPFRLCRN